MRITGMYEKLGDSSFFIPDPLPPLNPTLELLSSSILELYAQAAFNLGALSQTAERVSDQKRFIANYITKEALLSSAIEGIYTTLVDVFMHQQHDESKKNDKNTQLVVNYIQALDAARDMMQQLNLPICSRVILTAHKVLLSGGDNDQFSPGMYRKQIVKVGNLTPAPAFKIADLMHDLEKYVNEDSSLPVLIKAGLVHAQFEIIHSFLDGNGRIGRLLIMLMLLDSGFLTSPILYLSYYFKKNSLRYYQALDRVRTHGDFEGWIVFYLQAVSDTARDANRRAKDIEKLEESLILKIKQNPILAKNHTIAVIAVQFLFSMPIFTIPQLSKHINKVYNTTQKMVMIFLELGIITEFVEASHDKRSKYYKFDAYLNLLDQEYIIQ